MSLRWFDWPVAIAAFACVAFVLLQLLGCINPTFSVFGPTPDNVAKTTSQPLPASEGTPEPEPDDGINWTDFAKEMAVAVGLAAIGSRELRKRLKRA